MLTFLLTIIAVCILLVIVGSVIGFYLSLIAAIGYIVQEKKARAKSRKAVAEGTDGAPDRGQQQEPTS